MTTMQPVPRHLSKSDATLALLLLLGNLVFFGCVASRHLGGTADLSVPTTPSRITVIGA